jgi:NADH-quinone oxidoreductase subunit M
MSMAVLRWPWLELCVLIPAVVAPWVWFSRDPEAARRRSLVASVLALGCAVAAWLAFGRLGLPEARGWAGYLVIDELSAPKLPLVALLYVLTNLATLRTKVREFSFARALVSETILLATLGCKAPWGIVGLLAAGAVPPVFELRQGRKPIRVYTAHMALFVVLLVLGQWRREVAGPSTLAVSLLAVALFVRCGVVPLHCWMTDLFEHATFGTALLFVTPMVGAHGLVRLVLPVASPEALRCITWAAVATAAYAAGMALVQREARRFFCYLFLSHSSLVLVGLGTGRPIGLTGALSMWLSVALSLTGFGLALRCIEARTGRASLLEFHGLYPHIPMLAGLFLITGLASIGFPGTAGFVGLELLVEGAIRASSLVGAAVVIVTALNGLAVLHAYFRLFTGRPRATSIDLRIRPAEQASVLILAALILGGGLYPQPGITSRHHAAAELVSQRAQAQSESQGQGQARRGRP